MRGVRSLVRSDRAVSTVLGYVLALGITALLVGALMLAGGNYVDDQRERVVRSELSVVGERFATDLESADRIAATDGVDHVAVHSRLPDRLGGIGYQIEVRLDQDRTDHPNTYDVVVSATDPNVDVTVSTEVGLARDLDPVTRDSGDLLIVLAGDGDLEVRDA